nr:MAG TPA: hypothetical protein [Caudoviricetes sp.]
MANRLVASPDAFNVSVPGINVLAATGSGLQFDGNWASPARFVTGTISGSARQGTPSYQTVDYNGKTFSAKPFVMIKIQVDGENDLQGSGFGDSLYYFPTTKGSTFFRVKVGLDRIDFQTFVPQASASSFIIKYSVFDYRMGY